MPFTVISVQITPAPFKVGYEIPSEDGTPQSIAQAIDKAIAILRDNKERWIEVFAVSDELREATGAGDSGAAESNGLVEPPVPEPVKPRTRKGKAAAEAVAPAPIPVPGAAAPTPPAPVAAVATTTGDAGGIPDFLKRDAAPTAAAPPPPPLMPSAPPVAPSAATPQFILGNKIADNLQKRLDGSADKGEVLRTWLMPHVTAITVPTATIDEVIAVMRFTADDKVAHLAAPLGIS